jgi:hypothetical protein
MHELVHKHEVIAPTTTIQAIFDNKIVHILEFIAALSLEEKEYYKMIVSELYNRFRGSSFPVNNILSDWKAGESLGEVHSIAMCVFFEYDMFLSDDHESKALSHIAKEAFSGIPNIRTFNRQDALKEINNLSRKQKRALGHKG